MAGINSALAGITEGLAWLQTQQQTDGAYATAQDIALPVQATGETLNTFHALNQPLDANALAYLNNAAPQNTEWLARRIIAGAQNGSLDTTLIDTLKTWQNPDGGFGALAGYGSGALNTAWAARALAIAGQHQNNAARLALGWLLDAQQNAGQWQTATGTDDLILTAQVTDALWHYRHHFNIQSALDNARQWLMNRQNAGQWQDTQHTAWALRAILPGLSDTGSVQSAVDALTSTQNPDGNWNGDVYLTALSLQALGMAAQPAPNPDLASITGIVTNATTQQALANISVQLENAALTQTTDAQGRFTFTHLDTGAERLVIETAGYRPLIAPLNLRTGQRLDLGELRLTAGNGAESGVTITGIARYLNNNGQYFNANGARVSVGSLSTTTDAAGRYTLTNVPAGQINLNAAFSTFPGVQSAFSARGGDAVLLDLVFEPRQALQINATVTFKVTNGRTGQPYGGVRVHHQTGPAALMVTTDGQGEAVHARGLVAGENVFIINSAYSGYDSVVISLQLQEGQTLEVPVVMNPRSETSGLILKGTVTDAAQLPLTGVTVKLHRYNLETQTDQHGKYIFTMGGSNFTSTLTFEKTGFIAATYDIPVHAGGVSSGWTNVFDAVLTAQSDPFTPADMRIHVTSRNTAQPVANADILLSGATPANLQTDPDGMATITPLNPGHTLLQIHADGFESSVVSFDVVAGRTYELPVELLPETHPDPMLYGVVLDALSRQPLGGVNLSLSGANTANTVTDSMGRYQFTDISSGDIVLRAEQGNYIAHDRSFTLRGTTRTDIVLVPLSSSNPDPAWQVFGTIVDADTLDAIAGADLLLQEILPGSAVLAEQSGVSIAGGNFIFDGLTQDDARLIVSMPGYDTTVVQFVREKSLSQALGTIKLRQNSNTALPDLMLKAPDRRNLSVDPNTFEALGDLSVTVRNNSHYPAGAFNVIAFIDIDRNQTWDDGNDTLIARQRIGALAQQQEQRITFPIRDVTLPFRDAPIHVMIDSDLEIIETVEGNNTLSIPVSCGGNAGGLQDVGVCIDVSASVSNLYGLEMEGIVKAVENPNIIPHDGSIRFSLGTDAEMRNPQAIPKHQAVVIDPATLPSLINDLRSGTPGTGDSSIRTCGERISAYLDTLSPSNHKALILVGDGDWEPLTTAEGTLQRTIANGIQRIDIIGVGSRTDSVVSLEASAWPRPVNTPQGGKVTVANTAGDVADAMARALGESVRSVDLTLGNLQLIDLGNHRVRLSARIGNAGSISQDTTVRFYQNTVLLGEVAVASLRTGAYTDIALDNVTLNGNAPIEAVIDEDRLNAECNIANNRLQIPAASVNRLASLHVSTDSVRYGADAAATLGARIRNLGAFPGEFTLELRIEDSTGETVANYAAIPVGTLQPGVTQPYNQPWNTGRTLAGNYLLSGILYDAAGKEIAAAQQPFTIDATAAAGQPLASLRIVTDKPEYAVNDRVELDALAKNLALNQPVPGAKVTLTVSGPGNASVFTHTQSLGDLPAGAGIRQFSVPQRLVDAALGNYTVTGRLYDRDDRLLASDTATYRVAYTGVGALQGMQGSLAIEKTALVAGETQSRSDSVLNTGAATIRSLKVTRLVYSEADDSEILRHEETLDLNAGQTQDWQRVPIDTRGLAIGSYNALLIAESGGQVRLLDDKRFAITPLALANDIHAVPASPPLALIMLAVLLILSAALMRRGHRA